MPIERQDMKVEDLIERPGAWLSMGPETGVAISSRIRLARNIRGAAFPGWAGQDEAVRIADMVFEALGKLDAFQDALVLKVDQLDAVDRQILRERHLISNELVSKGEGSGLVVTRDESVAVMVNEEDHLRLQVISPGMDLEKLWARIDAIDTSLEEHLAYSFTPDIGYLTACPTNVGTGLRASVMVHLPGLSLLNEVEPVIKGLGKIGLAVRGLLGEGTEASGNMFQISNQVTLGDSEQGIIGRLSEVVREIIEHEQNARQRLMEGREMQVRDLVGRAHGILRQAHLLTSREMLDLLSGLRLGIELDLVKNADVKLINELMLLTQPGHLQRIMKQTINPEERDTVRARIVRERLAKLTIEQDLMKDSI